MTAFPARKASEFSSTKSGGKGEKKGGTPGKRQPRKRPNQGKKRPERGPQQHRATCSMQKKPDGGKNQTPGARNPAEKKTFLAGHLPRQNKKTKGGKSKKPCEKGERSQGEIDETEGGKDRTTGCVRRRMHAPGVQTWNHPIGLLRTTEKSGVFLGFHQKPWGGKWKKNRKGQPGAWRLFKRPGTREEEMPPLPPETYPLEGGGLPWEGKEGWKKELF